MPQVAADYWIALCWDRIPAGPTPGGPPWLFLLQEHAEHYAAQLRARGIPAQARGGWAAKMTDWQGQTLVKHPTIPAPDLEPHAQASLSSGTPEHPETHNGASTPSIQPPPTVE